MARDRDVSVRSVQTGQTNDMTTKTCDASLPSVIRCYFLPDCTVVVYAPGANKYPGNNYSSLLHLAPNIQFSDVQQTARSLRASANQHGTRRRAGG